MGALPIGSDCKSKSTSKVVVIVDIMVKGACRSSIIKQCSQTGRVGLDKAGNAVLSVCANDVQRLKTLIPLQEFPRPLSVRLLNARVSACFVYETHIYPPLSGVPP